MKKKITEPYLATYFHSKGRRLGLPISGSFELTSRCNFNCPMCYVHNSSEDAEAMKKELTAEQWISIAQSASERGMIFALITGGEPFLRNDFFEIYSAMKKMGLLVSINSNGSMINGSVLDRLLSDPPTRLNISLYGGCNETYKKMCGIAMYDQVFENIKALKNAGVDVRLNVSITQHNEQDIEKIFRTAEQLGVVAKAVSYMYPPVRINGGKFGVNERLTPVEAAECTLRWDALRFDDETFKQRVKNLMSLRDTERDECSSDIDEGVGCRAGTSSFWVTWDGKMQSCGMMPCPSVYPLQVGFDNAWEYIKAETKKIHLPPECVSCPKKGACFSCAAVCYTETGCFDKVPEYVCQMTDATIDLTHKIYAERFGKEDNE